MARPKYKLETLVEVKLDDEQIAHGTVGGIVTNKDGNQYRVYNGVEFVGEFTENKILKAYRPITQRTPKATKIYKSKAKKTVAQETQNAAN